MSMTADEMIAVIQAWKDGKKLQTKYQGDSSWWDVPVPVWDFGVFDYRVKPEPPKPREFWINRYNGDTFIGYAYPSKEIAAYSRGRSGIECVHVREVLDEPEAAPIPVAPPPRKPREAWVNVFNGNFGGLYSTKEAADQSYVASGRDELLHFREVLEGEP